ncbi:DUF1398 family protein [Neobacillus sp. YX16]|uniref:DUF1398 family protein n=1 Tax=Neobacillus sp. YX16 TaxID=3047874 RepID=UPI0024C341E5|nr:DUF1398 family protein [Neobacillus sp. YX16]WHZ03045.1 DUF1398 family protein [Neobacillus sp. YX16]
MSNKPTVKALHEIIERRSTGKTSFAEFLKELAAIGIIQYDIDVATGQATYKGEGSELKTEPQVNFVISNQFNRNTALETIANITLPFLDFLKEIANAGIITYTVNITEKKAIYIGINGDQIVEPLRI